MPATRSRTLNWRKSLDALFERNGALEMALAGGESGETKSLIWRVRILALNDSEIVVEHPMALGQTMQVGPGSEVVGVIVIGQNRWMFRTVISGATSIGTTSGLRLAMPEHVERCQRRNFYRVSTEQLALPPVDCYPLIDVPSAAVAEKANEVELRRALEEQISGPAPDLERHDIRLPEVGPRVPATLMNIGGGGVGLRIDPNDRSSFDGRMYHWLRIDLAPHVPAPIGAVGRLRHTHIDSTQSLYAGLSFEFGHHPEHQAFVVEQLCRYVELVQQEQSEAA